MPIPKVKVEQNEKISISIWFIPIIAFLISMWFAYQYFSELGPKITIYFESSGGLKVKQSQIKYLDLPIGTVKNIKFHKSGKGVVVTARINKDAKQFINENSKFWIVKPKIDKSGVSGLETLFSGSYIELNSKRSDNFKDEFKGLSEPHLDDTNIEGKIFKLNAPSSYNLEESSQVYYRGIEVGEIQSVKLSKSANLVEFSIFVKKPYERLINYKTQFWNVSNINFDISSSRLDMNFASLSQMIHGGIEFHTPKSVITKVLDDDFVFPLFSSLGEARQKSIGYNSDNLQTFVMNFSQSVSNLSVGAPIKLFNFQVGHVEEISSKFDIKTNKIVSSVITMIDLSAFNSDTNTSNLEKAVEAGLRAKLVKSNPILDTLHIDLVFDSKIIESTIALTKPYPTFPTKTSTFDSISNSIKTLVTKVEKLPLDKTIKEIDKTLKSVRVLSKSYSDGSKLTDEVSTSMQDMSNAAKALQKMLFKLDKKPNALIVGD